MKIIEMDIDSLIPYENNPRFNGEAVSVVAESIRLYGFQQPVVVDKNNVIVVGHTRTLAAKKLGLKTVPVVVADDLTDEEIRAYRLVDNKVAEKAEWDEEILKVEIGELLDSGYADIQDFFADKVADILIDEMEETENSDECTCPRCKYKAEKYMFKRYQDTEFENNEEIEI